MPIVWKTVSVFQTSHVYFNLQRLLKRDALWLLVYSSEWCHTLRPNTVIYIGKIWGDLIENGNSKNVLCWSGTTSVGSSATLVRNFFSSFILFDEYQFNDLAIKYWFYFFLNYRFKNSNFDKFVCKHWYEHDILRTRWRTTLEVCLFQIF